MPTSSIKKTIFKILFLLAIVPILFSITLLTVGWLEQSSRLKIIEDDSKNQAKYILALQLKQIEQLADKIGQSNELSSYIYSSENLKGFSENLVETMISNELQKLPMIKGLSIYNNEGVRILLVGNSEVSTPPNKSDFTISNDLNTLQFKRILKFDDQFLSGPSSRINGAIVLDISINKLIENIPSIKKLISISFKSQIEDIDIEVHTTHVNKIAMLETLIIMISILIISIIAAVFLIQKRLVIPMVNLINYVRSHAGIVDNGTQNDEIIELKNTFDLYRKQVEESHQNLILKSKSEILVSLANQVAHDIRSPLTALNVVMSTTSELPEEKRLLIRHAVQRINDIANNLLEKSKTSSGVTTNVTTDSTNTTRATSSSNTNDLNSASQLERTVQITKNLTTDNRERQSLQLISPLVDSLVSEKRTQYRDKINIQIEADLEQAYGLFAKINNVELQRVLSNLINNSVEAMADDKGLVRVSVRGYDNNINIVVFDTGKGIPQNILNKLGTESITYGKNDTNSGHGLGIPHAKKTIEHFGGKFEIQSHENNGTMITLTLPKQNPPTWFAEKITLQPNSFLVSIDDDLSIHQVWDEKLKTALKGSHLKHFSFTSVQLFKDWYSTQKTEDQKNMLFLIDHEFINETTTGLDLIEGLSIADSSILVTSHFDETDVLNRCEKLGVKIIPKAMTGFAPMNINS